MILRNKIIVNGKIKKTDTENESDVKISFTQHFLITLYVSIFWGSGLFAIILGIIIDATMYIPGGILLAVGIALWIYVHKRFERNIKKYKTLISEILEL
jgi:predicted RND superfamily exporter protein